MYIKMYIKISFVLIDVTSSFVLMWKIKLCAPIM